ncbi:hypothetical protein ACEQ8H_004929 [Pleosporales sp. CAS-2024a]
MDTNPLGTLGITALVLCVLPILVLLGLAFSQREADGAPPAGCCKLGITGPSHLHDQYSKKYARGGTRTPANPWTIKAMFIYPVKSCAPLELDSSEIQPTGLKYDRQFSFGHLVSALPLPDGKVESEWQCMTMRQFPRLVKIETEVWIPDPAAPGYREDGEWVRSDGCLVMRFPFSPDMDWSLQGIKSLGKMLAAKLAGRSEPMLEIRLPFNPPLDRIRRKRYATRALSIWNHVPQALDMAAEMDAETLAKLQYTVGASNPVTLFRIHPEHPRLVTDKAPKQEHAGFQTAIGMHDSYPVHILNMASVHHVASKMPRQSHVAYQMVAPILNVLRFRANLYVTGPPAFDEDGWDKARITSPTGALAHDAVDMAISCRTTRCKLPNVDPETADVDRNEPNSTLRKYRMVDEGSKNPCLGVQVVPLVSGQVKVGDNIEVV